MSLVEIEEFKTFLGKTRRQDVADDILLQAALDAAEEAICDECHRQFTAAGTQASSRSYVPDGSAVLRIHDCVEVTAISVDGVAVALGSVQLEPVNGMSSSGEVRPYDQIRLFTGWTCPANRGEATVAVEARWGWPSVPARVVEATKVLAKDVVANRGIDFGIAGITETAAVRVRANPQVAMLLTGMRRVESFGIA